MSSTVSAAQSIEQKNQAESFLRRVNAEFPHLLSVGYKKIIDVTVTGMKAIGIYNEGTVISEAQFMSGLRHAMDSRILPQPPARTETIVVQADPSPEQVKAERLALEEQHRREKFANQLANERGSGRVNHANRQTERASLQQNVKDALMPVAQQQAKALAEDLKAYTPQGKINWSVTSQLQDTFVWTDSTKSAVDWINTLSLRKKLQTAADNDARNRHNNR